MAKKDKQLLLDFQSQVPVYKQLIQLFSDRIAAGVYRVGENLPSMNELSAQLEISKETVKKVYSILRQRGLIESAHGKGFFVAENGGDRRLNVLMLFDKLSTYKFVLYQSFIRHAGDRVSTTIHLHNQHIDVFQGLLEDHLDNYDYYMVTAHFPLDKKSQANALKLLKRIPNRKLILLDRFLPELSGNYGAVYQDFSEDVFHGLMEATKLLKKYEHLHVIASKGSLYSSVILKGVRRFCKSTGIAVDIHKELSADHITKGGVYFVLNSQLDVELIELVRIAKAKHLTIGKDIGILSYNEAPINEIILDGLTVLSTDFETMGAKAAEMVLSGNLSKVHNDFNLVVRKTL